MRLLRSVFGPLHRFALVFDKDGTLLDTESLYFEAYGLTLQAYGGSHDVQTHAKMMGAPMQVCIEILQEHHPELPQGSDHYVKLREEFFERVRQVRSRRGVPIMPGSASILHQSREKRLPVAMATSAQRVNAEHDLSKLNWHKYFKAVVVAEDVQRHKPAPDVFLEAARRLGVEPGNCIAFEDGLRGFESARAAGMKTVFVRDKRFCLETPSAADLVVDSLDELFA